MKVFMVHGREQCAHVTEEEVQSKAIVSNADWSKAITNTRQREGSSFKYAVRLRAMPG